MSPETVKRDYTAQSKSQSKIIQKRVRSSGGTKYPAVPGGSDKEYEHTAAGKTKQKGI